MEPNEKDSKQISLDRARELLGDDAISDKELLELMDNLKQFCGIVSAVYKQEKIKEAKEEKTKEPKQKTTKGKSKGVKSAA